MGQDRSMIFVPARFPFAPAVTGPGLGPGQCPPRIAAQLNSNNNARLPQAGD